MVHAVLSGMTAAVIVAIVLLGVPLAVGVIVAGITVAHGGDT